MRPDSRRRIGAGSCGGGKRSGQTLHLGGNFVALDEKLLWIASIGRKAPHIAREVAKPIIGEIAAGAMPVQGEDFHAHALRGSNAIVMPVNNASRRGLVPPSPPCAASAAAIGNIPLAASAAGPKRTEPA